MTPAMVEFFGIAPSAASVTGLASRTESRPLRGAGASTNARVPQSGPSNVSVTMIRRMPLSPEALLPAGPLVLRAGAAVGGDGLVDVLEEAGDVDVQRGERRPGGRSPGPTCSPRPAPARRRRCPAAPATAVSALSNPTDTTTRSPTCAARTGTGASSGTCASSAFTRSSIAGASLPGRLINARRGIGRRVLAFELHPAEVERRRVAEHRAGHVVQHLPEDGGRLGGVLLLLDAVEHARDELVEELAEVGLVEHGLEVRALVPEPIATRRPSRSTPPRPPGRGRPAAAPAAGVEQASVTKSAATRRRSIGSSLGWAYRVVRPVGGTRGTQYRDKRTACNAARAGRASASLADAERREDPAEQLVRGDHADDPPRASSASRSSSATSSAPPPSCAAPSAARREGGTGVADRLDVPGVERERCRSPPRRRRTRGGRAG